MTHLSRTLAIALETVGIGAVIAGISVECILHADIGYICITGGSVVIAGGGLLFAKVIRKERS